MFSISQLEKHKKYILHHFDWSSFGKTEKETQEMRQRFVERGIVEGIEIEIVEWGSFGRDPIAISVNGGDFLMAMRKQDAQGVFVVEANKKENEVA